MKTRNLVLRAAMLAALVLAIAGIAKPARASGCFYGVYCENSWGVPGMCGNGGDNCICYSGDGSGSWEYDYIDCAQL